MASEQSSLRVRTVAKGDGGPPLGLRPSFSGLGIIDVTGQFTYHKHQHPHYEIIVVDRGPYRCYLNDALLELRRGQVLVVKPGDWHQDLLARPVRYFGLTFRLLAQSQERSVGLFLDSVQPAQQIFDADRRLFWPIIQRIEEEAQVRDAVSAQVQDALLLEFFWRLVRSLPRSVVSPQFLRQSAAEGFVARLKRVFHEQITASPRIEALAAAMNMSGRSLTHKCRRLLGASPAKAFARFKMERALTLLQQTAMPVKEIGFHLGFKNQFHFSRVFKRYHGQAPSRIRARSGA